MKNRSPVALVLPALLAVVALLATSPGPALAGEYTIATCPANGGYSSGAFEDFATRGMKWRRACDPLGPGLRGLVTANAAGEGHVAKGSQSAFVLEAPPETTFANLRWSGYAHRRDCRYALQLYAVRFDGSADSIRNVRADHHCPASSKTAQASSWPRPTGYELGGAQRIVQRVICMGAPKAEYCSEKGQNYLQRDPKDLKLIPFGVGSDGYVAASREQGQYYFRAGERLRYCWIGELKPDFAQRVASQIGHQFARVGVDGPEIRRRKRGS